MDEEYSASVLNLLQTSFMKNWVAPDAINWLEDPHLSGLLCQSRIPQINESYILKINLEISKTLWKRIVLNIEARYLLVTNKQ